jgi:hypothetical protein
VPRQKIDARPAEDPVHRVQLLILLVAQHRGLGAKVGIPAIVGNLHPQSRHRRRRRRTQVRRHVRIGLKEDRRAAPRQAPRIAKPHSVRVERKRRHRDVGPASPRRVEVVVDLDVATVIDGRQVHVGKLEQSQHIRRFGFPALSLNRLVEHDVRQALVAGKARIVVVEKQHAELVGTVKAPAWHRRIRLTGSRQDVFVGQRDVEARIHKVAGQRRHRTRKHAGRHKVGPGSWRRPLGQSQRPLGEVAWCILRAPKMTPLVITGRRPSANLWRRNTTERWPRRTLWRAAAQTSTRGQP